RQDLRQAGHRGVGLSWQQAEGGRAQAYSAARPLRQGTNPARLTSDAAHAFAPVTEHWYKPLESLIDLAVTPPSMPGQNLPCPPMTTMRFCLSHCQVFTGRKLQPHSTVARSVPTAAFCCWPGSTSS